MRSFKTVLLSSAHTEGKPKISSLALAKGRYWDNECFISKYDKVADVNFFWKTAMVGADNVNFEFVQCKCVARKCVITTGEVYTRDNPPSGSRILIIYEEDTILLRELKVE